MAEQKDFSTFKTWIAILGLSITVVLVTMFFMDAIRRGPELWLIHNQVAMSILALPFTILALLAAIQLLRSRSSDAEWSRFAVASIVSGMLGLGFGGRLDWPIGIGLSLIAVSIVAARAFSRRRLPPQQEP